MLLIVCQKALAVSDTGFSSDYEGVVEGFWKSEVKREPFEATWGENDCFILSILHGLSIVSITTISLVTA